MDAATEYEFDGTPTKPDCEVFRLDGVEYRFPAQQVELLGEWTPPFPDDCAIGVDDVVIQIDRLFRVARPGYPALLIHRLWQYCPEDWFTSTEDRLVSEADAVLLCHRGGCNPVGPFGNLVRTLADAEIEQLYRRVAAKGAESVNADAAPPSVNPYLFQIADKRLDWSGAVLRFRIIGLLWDGPGGRPTRAWTLDEVMEELYPGDDEADDKLKDLIKQVRRDFNREAVPLALKLAGGKVWLEVLPG